MSIWINLILALLVTGCTYPPGTPNFWERMAGITQEEYMCGNNASENFRMGTQLRENAPWHYNTSSPASKPRR